MSLRNEELPFLDSGALDSKRSLDVGALAANYGGVTVSRLKPGAVLYSQGEPADAMYYLQDGQLQITVVSSQGKEGILGVLEPGEFCGEGCLLSNRNRVATVTCLASSLVARLDRVSVIRAIREDSEMAGIFLTFALRRVVDLRANLISHLFDSSEKRLARALVLLANRGCNAGPHHVIRNVDQEALAHMIGTTRSRVNHFMNKLRRLRHIDYDGNVIVVHRSLSNVALSEDNLDASDNGIAVAC